MVAIYTLKRLLGPVLLIPNVLNVLTVPRYLSKPQSSKPDAVVDSEFAVLIIR